MKTTKIVTIATIVTIIIIALCGVATANAEDDTYEVTATITAKNLICGTLCEVIATTEDGTEFGFLADEDEDFHLGEVVILEMKDMSNEHDEEDEVIDVFHLDEIEK